MAAKPTATLRVEWPEQKLMVNEIIVVNQERRHVALKVLSITPDPLGTDVERKLLEHARRVAAQAELVVIGKKRLASVSRDGARYARNDIRKAIERLQVLRSHAGGAYRMIDHERDLDRAYR